MTCSHCGAPMKLVNSVRSLLLLYWCPTCQRFAEQHRSTPARVRRQPG